jgi:hypothetical protein
MIVFVAWWCEPAAHHKIRDLMTKEQLNTLAHC